MRTFLPWLAATLLATLIASGPAAGASAPGSGLIGSAHDFASASGNRIPNSASGGVGLCEFCHTLHKGSSTQLLWNHSQTRADFAWDIAKTTAGTRFPVISGGTYKGPSAKCLSCHDGSVAVGDISWFSGPNGSGPAVVSSWKMGDSDGNGHGTAQDLIGAGGNLAGNHPVAMPYSFGQMQNTYNGQTGGAGLVRTEWQPNPAGLSSSHIQLYNDDGSGVISRDAAPGRTGIECSSCHDPHNKDTMDRWFLRARASGHSQADGYICLQCHIK